MAFLVHPLPPENVFVRKEYLYDLEKGHGELTPGIWISVKSTQYKALYFETLLQNMELYMTSFLCQRSFGKQIMVIFLLMFCSFGIALITT